MRLGIVLLSVVGCSFDLHGVAVDFSVSNGEPDLASQLDLSAPDLTTEILDLTPSPDLATPFCPITPSLVACYRFDDGFHPTLIQDDSMYGNDATATGASFPAGVSGSALTLSASGSAKVPDAPSLDIPGPISYEMWVRANSLVPPAARYGLLDNDGQYGLFLQPNGRALCSLANISANSGDNAIDVGAWHHVACTYDRTILRIFVDGIQRGSANSTQAVATNGLNGLAVASNSPSGEVLNGEIDDLRIWNVARSTQEICEDAGLCP